MKQQDIYKKDINRPINGVIKADSIQELKVEITEFVITAEQQQDQKLPKFFHTLVPPENPSVPGFRATPVAVSLTF